jgi:hypothetical protein
MVEEMIAELKLLDPKAKMWIEDPQGTSFLPAMRVSEDFSNDTKACFCLLKCSN